MQKLCWVNVARVTFMSRPSSFTRPIHVVGRMFIYTKHRSTVLYSPAQLACPRPHPHHHPSVTSLS